MSLRRNPVLVSEIHDAHKGVKVSLTPNCIGNLVYTLIKLLLRLVCECCVFLTIAKLVAYLLAAIIRKWRTEFKVDRQHRSVALFLCADYYYT